MVEPVFGFAICMCIFLLLVWVSCLSIFYLVGWSGDSVLAFSTQVHGFKLGWGRRIFRAKKSSARLPSGRKYSRRYHVMDLRHVKDP